MCAGSSFLAGENLQEPPETRITLMMAWWKSPPHAPEHTAYFGPGMHFPHICFNKIGKQLASCTPEQARKRQRTRDTQRSPGDLNEMCKRDAPAEARSAWEHEFELSGKADAADAPEADTREVVVPVIAPIWCKVPCNGSSGQDGSFHDKQDGSELDSDGRIYLQMQDPQDRAVRGQLHAALASEPASTQGSDDAGGAECALYIDRRQLQADIRAGAQLSLPPLNFFLRSSDEISLRYQSQS
ncbi:hypothetical protein MMC29_003826 [Sticta canariensis]|nr:hypothetical protein [Sticta canariensis]